MTQILNNQHLVDLAIESLYFSRITPLINFRGEFLLNHRHILTLNSGKHGV